MNDEGIVRPHGLSYFFIRHSLFDILLFLRLPSGIEPCSPQSQCDALPNKLKTTFDAGLRLELRR